MITFGLARLLTHILIPDVLEKCHKHFHIDIHRIPFTFLILYLYAQRFKDLIPFDLHYYFMKLQQNH